MQLDREWCFKLDAIFHALCVVGLTSAAVLAVYLMICWFTVWKKQSSPERFDEIYWKKVDYAWIAIGSLGLVVQLVQLPVDMKVAEQKMQESIEANTRQSVNMAAARLSDAAICLPSAGYVTASVTVALADELKKACNEFQPIRPSNPTGMVLEGRVALFMVNKRLAEGAYKNPIVSERIEGLKRSWLSFNEQREVVQGAYAEAKAYEEVVTFLKYASLALLGFAMALRLAKVTAEIKLKRDSVKKKSDGDATELNQAARDLKESANALQRSATELGFSAGNINNTVGEFKGAFNADTLDARFARMEGKMRRHYWVIAGALLSLGIVLLFLQRAFFIS